MASIRIIDKADNFQVGSLGVSDNIYLPRIGELLLMETSSNYVHSRFRVADVHYHVEVRGNFIIDIIVDKV